MSGYFAVDPDWWELTVEKLPRPFLPETAMLDLRFHQDQALLGGRFPSRRELMARWGWTERPVRNLLQRHDLWGDPGKATAWEGWLLTRCPSKVPERSHEGPNEVPTGTGEAVKSVVKGPNEVPQGSQEGPNEVHMRVDPQSPTQAQAPENNKTSVGPPQLELTEPRASASDRFEEVAAYIGEVFNRACGRTASHGPERSSTRGKKLLTQIKRDPDLVLDAFRFAAEGEGASWHREKWVNSKGRSMMTVETVLGKLEKYAEGWRTEQLDGETEHKPYERGEHPGVPLPTEEEEEAALARWAAKGVR